MKSGEGVKGVQSCDTAHRAQRGELGVKVRLEGVERVHGRGILHHGR